LAGETPPSPMDIDTNVIRRSLVRITQKQTDKRMGKLVTDVLNLCDAYDEATDLSRIVQAGNDSLIQSFDMLEKLRKSL
jgi:molecular chaperone GrpE (heat shock protein)